MGMVWVARLASDEDVLRIKAEPDTAYDFINPEEDWEAAEPYTLDLDKEWHATHHMLTGDAGATNSPLSLIIGDFEAIGEDNGYGPALLIPAATIKAFHEALDATSDEAIAANYDPGKMQEMRVYLGDMYAREGEHGRAFLMERVQQLREFAKKGVEGGYHAFSVIT